jgi:ABC-type Fe3+ transport system substrate-binding protein
MDIRSLPDAFGSLSAGSGGLVVLVKSAPHPNAARVFVNWIASKEGLEVLTRAQLTVPTRADIDQSFVDPDEIPRPGVNYFDSYDWEFTVTRREQARLRLRELLSSQGYGK